MYSDVCRGELSFCAVFSLFTFCPSQETLLWKRYVTYQCFPVSPPPKTLLRKHVFYERFPVCPPRETLLQKHVSYQCFPLCPPPKTLLRKHVFFMNVSLFVRLEKHCCENMFLINVSLFVHLRKHCCGNMLFMNVSLFVHLEKHCCGNMFLIMQCFPVFPLREILIVAEALCFSSIRTSVFSHLKNIKIPWTAMLQICLYTFTIYISLSTYSRISSEPLNKVSGLSFISVSKDLPIVSCLLENFSNNRSFYITKRNM